MEKKNKNYEGDYVLIDKKKKVYAEGYFTERSTFVVKEGSTFVKEVSKFFSELKSAANKRSELINSGVLTLTVDKYYLNTDHEFNSISQAAVVILGRSADGHIEFKQIDNMPIIKERKKNLIIYTTNVKPKITFWDVIEKTIEKAGIPLSPKEIWNKANELGTIGDFITKGKTPWATISALFTQEFENLGDNSKYYKASENPSRFFLKKLKNNNEIEKDHKEKSSFVIDIKSFMDEDFSIYKSRGKLDTKLTNLFPNEPVNRSETILLLQSMISTNHPDIDFKIGQQKHSYTGVLLLEFPSENQSKIVEARVVYSLTYLVKNLDDYSGYQKVICWEIGDLENISHDEDSHEFKPYGIGYNDSIEKGGYNLELISNKKGRYNFNIKYFKCNIEVYVLKEILYNKI